MKDINEMTVTELEEELLKMNVDIKKGIRKANLKALLTRALNKVEKGKTVPKEEAKEEKLEKPVPPKEKPEEEKEKPEEEKEKPEEEETDTPVLKGLVHDGVRLDKISEAKSTKDAYFCSGLDTHQNRITLFVPRKVIDKYVTSNK